MTLTASISAADTRPQVIDDCIALVDSEVQNKRGLGGLVVKAGYKAVKGIKPGFIRKVVDSLLDEWAAKLEPIWAEAEGAGKAPRLYLETERARVAEALLSVTDAKSVKAQSGVVRKTYAKLRPTAKEHVEQAVPGLAAVLDKHAG